MTLEISAPEYNYGIIGFGRTETRWAVLPCKTGYAATPRDNSIFCVQLATGYKSEDCYTRSGRSQTFSKAYIRSHEFQRTKVCVQQSRLRSPTHPIV